MKAYLERFFGDHKKQVRAVTDELYLAVVEEPQDFDLHRVESLESTLRHLIYAKLIEVILLGGKEKSNV